MHADLATLNGALPTIRASPLDGGTVELIVRRPDVDARDVVTAATLDPATGLVGDTWIRRPSRHMPDGGPHPKAQLTLMNARAIAAIAGARERWPLAGDQLYVDLDLSFTNLAAGTRLAIGTAVIEVTDQPHTGCTKFAQRFGLDAVRFIGSPEGSALRLRGINTRIVSGGVISIGDSVTKL